MRTLFDDPPSVSTSPTSVAAAESVKPDAGRLRGLVLGAIRKAGVAGLTCDECEVQLDMRHQTCSARFRELAKAGVIVDSGRKRETRSGRKAVVWCVV